MGQLVGPEFALKSTLLALKCMAVTPEVAELLTAFVEGIGQIQSELKSITEPRWVRFDEYMKELSS